MSVEKAVSGVSREVVMKTLVEVLEDMTSEWDIEFSGKIDENTLLVEDLAFESIDVVHLIVTLGEVFNQKDLGFERLLMVDGRYVSDLNVAAIGDFLTETLAARGEA